MAKIGLKYIVCAEVEETGKGKAAKVAYKKGLVMGKAIKVDLKVDINDAKLYGDDMVAENKKEFKGGTLSVNTDDLSYEVISLLLGHEKETIIEPEAVEMLTAKGDDDGAYVGVGFYSTVVRGGVKKFRAIWLRKNKFGIPGESLETKGENINFQTPTIEGTVMQDITGIWKQEAIFEKEESAVEWLNEHANIDQGSGA